MNFEEILKRASEEIDEILSLKKSIDAKMEKEAEEMPEEAPISDAESDLLHNADAHGEEGDVGSYAAQLSDEELYELLSALSEEAEQRGVGQDQPQEEMEEQNEEIQEPGEEETEKAAPEMEEAPDDMAPPAEDMGDISEEAPLSDETAETAPEAEEAGEFSEGEEIPEEGAEEGSIEEKIAGLADDELDLLLQAVSAELDARQGGQPAEGGEEELVSSMGDEDMEKSGENDPRPNQSPQDMKLNHLNRYGAKSGVKGVHRADIPWKPGQSEAGRLGRVSAGNAQDGQSEPRTKLRTNDREINWRERQYAQKIALDAKKDQIKAHSDVLNEQRKMPKPNLPKSMAKSVQEESISDLRKSIEELESVMESISNKTFADPKVKVLEKSVAEEQAGGPLLGNDLQNWLLSEQKAGKKKVGSDLVVKAGLVKSEEMAESFYAELRSIGLTPPKK